MDLKQKLAATELLKRQKSLQDNKAIIAGLYATLFTEQRAFLDDPSNLKTALCTRQAGKTYAAAVYLLIEALKTPKCTCIYIATSRQSAKDIILKDLEDLRDRFKIDVKINYSELKLRFANGSEIALYGAADSGDTEKFRGQKYKLVIIDEAASFAGYLQDLVQAKLRPALIKWNGTLALIGTPGSICTGLFYKLTFETKDTHRWSIRDNPFIENVDEWLAKERALQGWTEDHPIYQREYGGKWVQYSDSLVYHLTEANIVKSLPPGEYDYVMGVDLGSKDAFAISVLACSKEINATYVVDNFAESNLGITDWAAKIKEYRDKWVPSVIVCDAGGLGKSIVEDITRRFNLPIEAAYKAPGYKPTAIETLNGDFLSKRLHVLEGLEVIEQMRFLQWKDGKKNIAEDPGMRNDLCDATLYAYRKSYAYLNRDYRKPIIKEGSREYWQDIADKMKASRLQSLRNNYQKDDVDLFEDEL